MTAISLEGKLSTPPVSELRGGVLNDQWLWNMIGI
jgi:hypothetical protein